MLKLSACKWLSLGLTKLTSLNCRSTRRTQIILCRTLHSQRRTPQRKNAQGAHLFGMPHRTNARGSCRPNIMTMIRPKVHFVDSMQRHLPSVLALHYTGRWCCDSSVHSNTFALERLFLGPVHTEQPAPPPAKRKRTSYRPTNERPELEELLVEWRTAMHSRLTLRAIRPPSFILDSTAIKKLTMARASSITSAASVTELLKQSPELEYLWAEQLFKLISEYKPAVDDEESEEEEPQPKRGRK